MFGALVLLTLAPVAANVEQPAPVAVTVEHYAYPPQITIGANGMPQWFNVDDGHFVEVTVKNTSKEILLLPYVRRLHERVDVEVTDEKGVKVSLPGRQNGFRKAEDAVKIHVFKPGESFTIVAHLEQNWPDEPECRNPGKYTARIVFHSGTIRAEGKAAFTFEIIN